MRLPGSLQGLKNLVKWINDHVFDTSKKKMVEIGCFAGDSTEIFCNAFKKVTTIDPWTSGIGDVTDRCDMQEVYEGVLERFKDTENIKIIKGFSFDIVEKVKDNSLDMIYVDGAHDYANVSRDLKQWIPKVKKGGVIAGHDYRRKFEGVIKAVHENVGTPDKIFKDTSWLKVKE